jgi:glycosyltransferase involved in cell wall biosynthesis
MDPTSKMNTERKKEKEETKRVRVLVVAPSFDILGGQAVQAARLMARLRELDSFEIGFLPINPRLPGFLRTLQAIKYLRTVVTSFLYLIKLLTHVPRYDVIHVFSASYFSFVLAPTPAILIAKLFRKRVLLNYHSGEAEDHFTRWPSAISIIRLADSVVVPSEYLVRIFRQFGIEARAINNLIELSDFDFRERSPLRPLFLSNRNLETHYGVDHVLRSFALIQANVPDAELIVGGDGSQRAKLERLASELGLKNTTFVGRVEPEAIVEQYRDSHIYLNASEIDNQPLSILEAFACGLPIVSTNAGGIPDMITDGETGCLVSCGDHEAMANRAVLLLSDGDLAGRIAQRANGECVKYSWENVGAQWTAVYRELGETKSANAAKSAGAPSKLRKIRSMGFAELSVRATQSLSILSERKGWSSLTKLPSDKDLNRLLAFPDQEAQDFLDHFRTRTTPSFFESFNQPEAVLTELRHRWPLVEAQIIAEADQIVAGHFDLLGLKQVHFGDPIDWRLEPVSRRSAPHVHWSEIDYLDPQIAGDKKITWELNRHQHFIKLGQAYWLTGDEKYARAFVSQLNSWMDQNPPKLGINWASSLEISFRSIAWLWAFHFFKNSKALDGATFNRALKFLYLNGRHLETYLSTYFSPNTHLTGEAVGLFYLGTVLPEFRAAAHWRDQGQRILVEQLQKQVRADGVYFEQSSYYQRYTVDFYLHLLVLSRANKLRLSAAVEEKLTALLDHLMYLTRPDGTTPLFGDEDGGRLLPLDRRATSDFRGALATGAVLFDRCDYKFVARRFALDSLWLLGPQGGTIFDELRAEEPGGKSQGFADGGYYIMRDGWHDRANYLLFGCGPHGAGNCGHAHADALTIEVIVNGEPLLVDAGTYTYTGSPELRDSFRGSSAHNVLLIDGEPSSRPAGPFSWETIAEAEPLSWITERRFDYVSGRHNGYERLSEPAVHTRSILFLKNDYWLMRDRVTSNGNHKIDLRFHFAATSNAKLSSVVNEIPSLEVFAQRAGLRIAIMAPTVSDDSWRREEGWLSNCYGSRECAPVWSFSCNFSGKKGDPDELVTVLMPTSGRMSANWQVKEVEAIGGRAFQLSNNDFCDLVLLRDEQSARVETVRMASDCNLSWARFSVHGNQELAELLVMDGRRVDLDGKKILSSQEKISYLVASRTGERFRVETSDGLNELDFPMGDFQPRVNEVISHCTVRN